TATRSSTSSSATTATAWAMSPSSSAPSPRNMARLAVTIGFPHDGGHPQVITGPEVEYPKHRESMRELRATSEHPTWERVEIWTRDGGLIGRKRLNKPSIKE